MELLKDFMWPLIGAGLLVALLILVRIMTSFWVKVPPHKAAFFYGAKSGKKKGELPPPDPKTGARVLPPGTVVVTGGGRLRKPIVEAVEWLDLSEITLTIQTHKMANKDGVLINVDAVANIRFKDDADSLLIAGGRFLGKNRDEIMKTAQETLESNLRGVIGRLTVEQLISDRETFRQEVLKEAGEDLSRLGLQIDVFNPQNITDEQGYIEALGQKRTAEVKRDAEIGKAVADSEAKQKSTTADREAEVVNQDNDKLKAEAKKTTDVAKQQYKAEVSKVTAEAEQAGPLATAKAKQAVVVQEVKIEEEQARALIAVEEQNIKREEKKQEAEVVVPAKAKADAQIREAEGYRTAVENKAEGDNKAIILKADAEAHKRKVEGEGAAAGFEAEGLAKAKVIRETGLAEAAVVEAKGLAEAAANKAKLLAEAEGLAKKAEAYKQFTQAAIWLEVIRELPPAIEAMAAVFGNIAAPLGNIDKVVVFDGGSGSKDNVSALTRMMTVAPVAVGQFMEIAKAAGIDLTKLGDTAKAVLGNTISASDTTSKTDKPASEKE